MTTIDQYLASVASPMKEALQAVRATILSVEPSMQERISSGAPFFWHRGRRAVGFGAARDHLSFYIMHGAVLKQHREALSGFETVRTVIRFTHDNPLPAALIRKLVRWRIEEIERTVPRPSTKLVGE